MQYALKNIIFANKYDAIEDHGVLLPSQQHTSKKVRVKRLLETSIYLAQKGGIVLKGRLQSLLRMSVIVFAWGLHRKLGIQSHF
jgi:hypothetical protein